MMELNLNLEEQIGQMLMMGFTEPFSGGLPEDIKELIRDYHIGGVIIFSRNVQTTEQVRNLTFLLQEEAEKSSALIPLLISADQEGGNWMLKIPHICTFPGNMALAAIGDADLVYQTANIIAREALALGINTVLAPVLDVNIESNNPIIGVRAFSDYAPLVSLMGESWLRGCEDAGALATAKHFPGHGRTIIDSHKDLPIVETSKEELEAVDLLSFKVAVEEECSLIMTTHSAFPSLSGGLPIPATISKEIVKDLLRNKMGYKGLIITDCMEMNAITRDFGVARGAVEAVKAGVDIILISHTFALQKEVFHSLVKAVKNGEIPVSQIEESVKRILQIKGKKLKNFEFLRSGSGKPLELIGSKEHRFLEQEVADKSITLLRNYDNILPLTPDKFSKLVVIYPNLKECRVLPDMVRKFIPDFREITIPILPGEEDFEKVLKVASEGNAIIVITASQTSIQGKAQGFLISELIKMRKPLVVGAINSPYDLQYYPEVRTLLVSYGYKECNLKSLVEVIFGKVSPAGKLPINLLDLYPRGFGLSYK